MSMLDSQGTDHQTPEVPWRNYETEPFIRGSGDWQGVVMIERTEFMSDNEKCRVTSGRRLDLGGMRAIVSHLPYGMLKHYFNVEDGDNVCVYAELKNGHLEFYERASLREFLLFDTPNAPKDPRCVVRDGIDLPEEKAK